MDVKGSGSAAKTQVKVQQHSENEMGIRKGPWTVDEDTILVNYVTTHGEGHWNSVARFAGLRRSGKSCRLRWLNYLRPDVRRGNITLQEQILILELHSRWGNRWSKIAKHLPGRTDNEIKNYWRTRVIKQAKQLKCDVNSELFRDTLRHVWMPRMLERVNPSGVGLGGFLHRTGFLGSGTDWAQPNHSHSDSSSSAEFLAPSNSNHTDSSGSVHASDSDLWSGFNNQVLDQVSGGHDLLESLWGDDNFWFLQQLSE